VARPITTSYTDEEKAEVAAHVLVNVACGRFVSRIFREDTTTESGVKLPAAGTFWRWVLEDDTNELDDKLVRARERGIEALVDETIDIADEREKDALQPDLVQRSRLRIETRLKLAAMLKPKKYGDKLDLTTNGERLPVDDVTRATRLASIMAEIEKRNAAD
jgi:hypothetical protein